MLLRVLDCDCLIRFDWPSSGGHMRLGWKLVRHPGRRLIPTTPPSPTTAIRHRVPTAWPACRARWMESGHRRGERPAIAPIDMTTSTTTMGAAAVGRRRRRAPPSSSSLPPSSCSSTSSSTSSSSTSSATALRLGCSVLGLCYCAASVSAFQPPPLPPSAASLLQQQVRLSFRFGLLLWCRDFFPRVGGLMLSYPIDCCLHTIRTTTPPHHTTAGSSGAGLIGSTSSATATTTTIATAAIQQQIRSRSRSRSSRGVAAPAAG
jgi:hypothetical protein